MQPSFFHRQVFGNVIRGDLCFFESIAGGYDLVLGGRRRRWRRRWSSAAKAAIWH
jgi:hypothetical protein